MAEIWDLIDKNGVDLGIKWPRSEHANIPEGHYHLCVEVWVKIGKKLLLARRHPDKSEGLKLDCPGGAVVSGESVICGALRELYEEVGIEAAEGDLRLLGRLALGKAYAVSYLLILDHLPEIKLQPSEVVDFVLLNADEIEAMSEELTGGTRRRYAIYKQKIFEE